jgi:soluble P-type ATPase
MRRAAKVDANQEQVVSALRAAGATVQSLAAIGKGCPDLLVMFRGALFLLEVKDGGKVKSAQKLTDAQVKWHQTWGAMVEVVNSPEQALRAIGAIHAV